MIQDAINIVQINSVALARLSSPIMIAFMHVILTPVRQELGRYTYGMTESDAKTIAQLVIMYQQQQQVEINALPAILFVFNAVDHIIIIVYPAILHRIDSTPQDATM